VSLNELEGLSSTGMSSDDMVSVSSDH
jgi:hypothetical protein